MCLTHREPGPHPNIALRTYVYHQMLIGYLSFVKMLGFEQMYIWACPPMQVRVCVLVCECVFVRVICVQIHLNLCTSVPLMQS